MPSPRSCPDNFALLIASGNLDSNFEAIFYVPFTAVAAAPT
jgi:hypothetical protein